jgi:NTP pyrophosphatase (non-canonical NTP hydrolase)
MSTTETAAAAMTLPELLEAVKIVDAHIDANTAPDYLAQPLALDWARVTKVCEEAGEVWAALSKYTGENPRKGVCGTLDDLLGELGDTASAAICAIQHLTKDTDRTWEVVSAALAKARSRVGEPTP